MIKNRLMKKFLFLFLFSLLLSIQAHAKLFKYPYEPLCVSFLDRCSLNSTIRNFSKVEPKGQCEKPWYKNEKFLEVCRYEEYTIGKDVIFSDDDLKDRTIRPVGIYYYENGNRKINTKIPSYVMEHLSPEETKELHVFYQREAYCRENVKTSEEDIKACSYDESIEIDESDIEFSREWQSTYTGLTGRLIPDSTEFLSNKNRPKKKATASGDVNSPIAWKIIEEVKPGLEIEDVIHPQCFNNYWTSADNYQEFYEKFVDAKEGYFDSKEYQDFTFNIGKYWGREITTYDPIKSSWNEDLELAVSMKSCKYKYSRYFDILRDRVTSSYENDEYYYQVIKKIPQETCQALAPHIDGKCLESNLLKIGDWDGGTIGYIHEWSIFGLFKLSNGDEYIFPLKRFESEKEAMEDEKSY